MKYLVHGEDIVSSRNYLSSLKKQYQNTVSLEGEKLSLEKFKEIAFNPLLFPGKALIVVENFPDPKIIFSIDSVVDAAFWWPITLEEVPKADKIVYFKEKKAFGIFKFADSVGQRQIKTSLSLLNNLFEEKVSSEKIISILTRQLKLIVQVLDGDSDKVSSSDFVKKKLIDQSKLWSIKKIHIALALLFQIDIKIKKGVTKPEVALTFLAERLCKL